MRIGLLGFIHESNTFISAPTTLEQFSEGSLYRGQQLLARWKEAHHKRARQTVHTNRSRRRAGARDRRQDRRPARPTGTHPRTGADPFRRKIRRRKTTPRRPAILQPRPHRRGGDTQPIHNHTDKSAHAPLQPRTDPQPGNQARNQKDHNRQRRHRPKTSLRAHSQEDHHSRHPRLN